MPTTKTPLRYPGGKSRLAPYLACLLKHNNLTDRPYVEPFAGGAGAALSLLQSGIVSEIHLNDVDRRIYLLWRVMLNQANKLCERIAKVELTIDEWHVQRSIATCHEQHTDFEVAFATLFMNRTNRSGIIDAGVIGGKNQISKWQLSARFNRDTLIKKIQRISAQKNQIFLYCKDASDFLCNALPRVSGAPFIYLDPPFYRQGKNLYRNYYQSGDHAALASLLRGIANKTWIVSYDNVSEIKLLYHELVSIEYGISYSAGDKYIGKEIIFFSPSIIPPPISDPLKVKNQR